MRSQVAPEHMLLGIIGNFNHNHCYDAHLVEGQTEFIDMKADIGGMRVNYRCDGVAQYELNPLSNCVGLFKQRCISDSKEMRRVTRSSM